MPNQQLLDILKEARQLAAEDRQRPITECPCCGEPLQFRNGIGNCPLGHFRTTKREKGAEWS